jgi:hypothetical protein
MGCSVEGCARKHMARGLCKSHYNGQWERAARQRRAAFGPWCSVAGCTAPSMVRGMCRSHEDRARCLFGVTPCRRHDCDRAARVRGLCRPCYVRVQRGTLAVCIAGCTPKKLYAQGMCQACYKRRYRADQRRAA